MREWGREKERKVYGIAVGENTLYYVQRKVIWAEEDGSEGKSTYCVCHNENLSVNP